MSSDAIAYVGVDDHDIDLFEGQYAVPNGMAYNSYVVRGEKTAVMDSVDARFGEQWLANIAAVLDGRAPDYLVVQHMEMDHSANIKRFAETYPAAKIVSSQMAFMMMKNYFGTDFADQRVVVADGATLELGADAAGKLHTLQFISAPNVHWPEVLFTYDAAEQTLFSADAFGTFGALDAEKPADWAHEARRYYFGIVGKFGVPVQAALKKVAALDVQTIAPLHGPVLVGSDITEAIRLYSIWANYGVESEGVAIAYTSVYGNTKQAAERLAELLREKGCPVAIFDLARTDTHQCVADAFRYGTLVLASTTYTGGVFPTMREFIEHLTARGYQNRTVAFIENGSWMPAAAKTMAALFAESTGITFVEPRVTMKIAVTADTMTQLAALADALVP